MNILSHKEAETFFKNTLEHIAKSYIKKEFENFTLEIKFNWRGETLEIRMQSDDDNLQINESNLIDKIYSDFNQKTGEDLDEYCIDLSIN